MTEMSSLIPPSPSRSAHQGGETTEGISLLVSPNIASSSPLQKRRSHLQRVAVDGVRWNSVNNKKRVSFHEDHHSNLPRSPWPARDSLIVGHQYQSNWVLAEDANSTILSPQIRRYQSDCFLNQLGEGPMKQQQLMPLTERGVPEGQEKDEDPEHGCSFQNLSVIATAKPREEMLILPKRFASRLSSSGRSSARNSVSSIKSLGGVEPKPKVCRTPKDHLALAQWAQEQWSRRFSVNLPLPSLAKSSSMANDHDVLIPHVMSSSSAVTGDGHQRSKIFKGFGDFYSGNPRRYYLLISEESACVTSTPSGTSPLWSLPLINIDKVTVKWNYSILDIRSATSGDYSIEFADPAELRSAASWLGVYLQKIHRQLDMIAVELPSECKRSLGPSILKGLTHGASVSYVGFIFFEESFVPLRTNSTEFQRKCGHLMYCWSHNRTWHAGYFVIKQGLLHQYNNPEEHVPVCTMSLNDGECIGYGRNFNSSRPHTIEIQFRGKKCLQLAAASEMEASDWLSELSQSLSMEETAASPVEQSKLPSACGIIVTQRELVLFRTGQRDGSIIASAPLASISAVLMSQLDPFCLIEYDCQEAHEGAGDWILYFQSSNSFEEFLQATNLPRHTLSNEMSSILRNKSLILMDL